METQLEVDNWVKEVQEYWNKLTDRPTGVEVLLLTDHNVRNFLLNYQQAKLELESLGFTLPKLTDKVVVNIQEEK